MARILRNATQRNATQRNATQRINTSLDTLINAASEPPTPYTIPCGGLQMPSARDCSFIINHLNSFYLNETEF